MIYLISKDKIITFEDLENIFKTIGLRNLQLDNRQTPHSPVAINLPKYSPDIGLSEKHCLENSLEGAHTHIYTYTCWCQYWGKH